MDYETVWEERNKDDDTDRFFREGNKKNQENLVNQQTKGLENAKRKRIRKGQPIKNKLKNFVVLYLNIRGIQSKIKSLNNIAEEIQPTIICITETHLMDEEDLQIDGYKNLRNDRDRDGGGVLIAVQEKLYGHPQVFSVLVL